MKLNFKYILFASAAILAAVACNKSEPDNQQPNTPIAISATEAGVTKALLDNGTFNTTGNRIQVYDFVDGAETAYIDDRIGPDVEGSPLAENTAGVRIPAGIRSRGHRRAGGECLPAGPEVRLHLFHRQQGGGAAGP